MCSSSPFLNSLAASHETQKYFSVRFLCPKEELDKESQNGLGYNLQLGI
jgi:hypothetical protein